MKKQLPCILVTLTPLMTSCASRIEPTRDAAWQLAIPPPEIGIPQTGSDLGSR
jgi:hypothetical protein